MGTIFERKKRNKLLLIGPLPNTRDVVGGTKVAFSKLVNEFIRSNIYDTKVIDTSRPSHRKNRNIYNLYAFVRVMKSVWMLSKSTDLIMANFSPIGGLRIGPIIWGIAKARKIPVVFRFFGGDLDVHYDACSFVIKSICKNTILKSNLLLVETKYLENKFKSNNIRWFPNTRPLGERTQQRERKQCSDVVFISRLCREKGIEEVCETALALEALIEIHVYGEPDSGFRVSDIPSIPNLHYHGSLKPGEVKQRLQESDLLLFPSYHPGEGYPGIIIEAFQVGVPVIATKWKYLPELVSDGYNGLLIEPHSSKALTEGLLKLINDKETFEKLSKGAANSGRFYDQLVWHEQLERWMSELTDR